jgi:hypothetical protein
MPMKTAFTMPTSGPAESDTWIGKLSGYVGTVSR